MGLILEGSADGENRRGRQTKIHEPHHAEDLELGNS